MAIEMKVPPVGESITEVTIATWSKKSGDLVKRDEIICELESDKATFELPAESDGVLTIIAKEGDTLAIGAVICTIEAAGQVAKEAPVEIKVEPANTEKAATTQDAPKAATGTQTTTIEIKVPAVGESITEVTIASWSKANGSMVKLDEIICELESDKATFELPSQASGVLNIVAQTGAVVPIGGLVAAITVGGESSGTTAAPIASVSTTNEAKTGENQVMGHPTPVAAKILEEKGIDPATVAGTGAGGRIMKDDAVNAIKAAPVAAQTLPSAPTPAVVQAPVVPGSRGMRRQKMSSLRKTVAKRLVAVKNETAMLTTFNEVDMKPIMDIRAKYKDKFKEKHGVGLGFMSFFTKAVCVALSEFPTINAKIDGDEIVFNDFCDISIAVSAPKGLVVPVVRNAETLGLAEIEAEILRLAMKARENKLTLEEMTGGTFTITNGGVFGSMLSTPIINAPQVAILGMHNIVERAVVVEGQIVVRPIMYLALSYDHRIIDGKESVSFLVRVKQLLEDPNRLLLDV